MLNSLINALGNGKKKKKKVFEGKIPLYGPTT